jgi:hypothetical protein
MKGEPPSAVWNYRLRSGQELARLQIWGLLGNLGANSTLAVTPTFPRYLIGQFLPLTND